MTLSEHLMQRGLNLEPVEIQDAANPILNDPELTKSAAELWDSKQSIINKVLQVRVNAIAKVILESAVPQEVTVLRQALVELSAIVDDFQKYKGKADRDKAETANQEQPDQPAEDIPTPADGAEPSSL
jgi:hypothetical protein